MWIYANKSELNRFPRRGNLVRSKLIEYIPVMMITQLSILLITSVDGIVAGNYVGEEALSSISIFFPVSLVCAAVSVATASGIGTSISVAMGSGDMNGVNKVKAASLYIMVIIPILFGIIQIPVVWVILKSYGLSEEIYRLTWEYAIGCMISSPMQIVTNIGTYELQIAGKMRILMILTIVEGGMNVVFDMLFTGFLGFGVAGVGFGTACTILIRCALSLICIYKYTDLFKINKVDLRAKDILSVVRTGVPDGAYPLINAVANYFMVDMICDSFGDLGGSVIGVCTFCLNAATVVIFGLQSAMRPMMGLYAGCDDKQSMRALILKLSVLNILFTGAVSVAVILMPGLFYRIHGVDEIPSGGLTAVRLYALFFVFKGLETMLRQYFTARKDIRFASVLTVLGYITLPVFAFILSGCGPAPLIFLSYTATELLITVISYIRYFWWVNKDKKGNVDETSLYMTVTPSEAVEASRYIRKTAAELGVEPGLSYRLAICMEEMVAYAQESGRRKFPLVNGVYGLDILIKFMGTHKILFITLDDGKCIALDNYEETQQIVSSNYGLIKKLAAKVEYQYLLNMNYTWITLGA